MPAIPLALGASLVYGVSDFLGGLKSRSVGLLSVLLISQATAMAVLATGAAVLGERPGVTEGTGIVLALAGIAIISSEPGGGRSTAGARLSVVFGLLTALGFGGFLVGMGAASDAGVVWALLVARLCCLGSFVAAFVVLRPPLRAPLPELPSLALVGLLIVAADAMYAVATTAGALSVVAVLSSLYPAVTIALARAFLGERLEPTQKAGAATALCGVVAISAA